MSSSLNLDALEAINAAGSPPGWRWNVNVNSRLVYLESDGRGRGLEYVMDFTRWGMNGAAPRFRNAQDLMVRVDELTGVVPGREHHQKWYRTVKHPDADLIVAARNALPLLVAEVRRLRSALENAERKFADGGFNPNGFTRSTLRAALSSGEEVPRG